MTIRRSRQPRNLQGIALLLVLVIAAGFLFLRLRELPPSQPVAIPMDAPGTPTAPQPSWQEVLQQQVIENATALPTVDLPTAAYVAPTIPQPVGETSVALEPTQLFGTAVPTNTPLPPPPSPTRFGPTAQPTPVGEIQVANVPPVDTSWQPPPMQGPISLDPRDHYWLSRPADSNATNYGLFYYPYGADGPENQWRVHHGIDMANPVGERVRAAGPGIVLWAANGFRVEEADGSVSEFTSSYGNTVLVQHDFSYRGQPIYTLYAHMSAILVARGQQVQTGDILGLIGDTGIVSGSHVHFEVRVGRNSWYAVRNPVMWIVPYIGHGLIAGRVIGPGDELLADQDISVIDRQTGRIVQTVTSYIPADTNSDGLSDVSSDDAWDENFALGDIPEGRYQVVTRIGGERVSRIVDVRAGMTAFVELALSEEVTPQAPAEVSQ